MRLLAVAAVTTVIGCYGQAPLYQLPPTEEDPVDCACEARKAKAVFACFKFRERCVDEPGHHPYTPTCFETACRFDAYTRAIECAEACGLSTREYRCRAHCAWIMDTCLRGQAETGGPSAGRPNRCAELEWQCYAESCPEVLSP